MSRFGGDLSDAEQLIILAALAVGGYMLYTLYQTVKNGPGELADWVGQEWDAGVSAVTDAASTAETAVASGFNSSSGLNPANAYADPNEF